MSEDALIERILDCGTTVAMVGASPRPERDSHGVMRFLQQHGYRVIPVNPTCAGQQIHGETVVARVHHTAIYRPRQVTGG